eukprot:m.1015878 g.1015878  ORF g.1015878 m.1015878 type:complete len:477 (-) comp24077_c0_seq43:235-1665(-)
MALFGRPETIYIVCCILIGFLLRMQRKDETHDSRHTEEENMDVSLSHTDNWLHEEQVDVHPSETRIVSTAVTSIPKTLLGAAKSKSIVPTDVRSHIRLQQPLNSTDNNSTRHSIYTLATRKQRVVAALPDLFSLVPRSFVDYIKNPCWIGKYREDNGRGALQAVESLMCMPDFYIIGSVKGGTSDLWQFISKHPDVNTGGVLKEQHYFSRPWISAAQYIARYKRFATAVQERHVNSGHAVNCVAGDATPDLIWSHVRTLNRHKVNVTIAEVLAELHPRARLVLTVREPASRLWSDFFYFAHRPNSERDIQIPHPDTSVTAQHFHEFATKAATKFQSCIDAHPGSKDTQNSRAAVRECTYEMRNNNRMHASHVRFAMGCYGPLVEEYLAHFKREQLLVVSLEGYKQSPQATLERVFKHIGVRPPTEAEWKHILGRRKVTNEQGDTYKKLVMLNSTRATLTLAYAPCLESLRAAVGPY